MTERQQKYLAISQEMLDVLDDMKKHWDNYPDYLGWADLRSPILDEPDILFIGINPGPGRFVKWNWSNWNPKSKRLIDPSQKALPQDYPNLWRSHLQWFAPDNARENGEWWDSTKGKKNHYPYYMCELLVRIYRHDFPSVKRQELTEIIEKKVMDINLFPMSTHNIQGLGRLIKEYDKENNSDIRNICHRHILDLISLVNPRCIVLLGKSVHSELSRDLGETGLPYYCISRNFGWHSNKNITKMADEIYTLIHNNKSELWQSVRLH